MLYLSLGFSFALLGCVWLASRLRVENPVVVAMACAVGVGFLFGALFPAVGLQAVFLFVGLLGAAAGGFGRVAVRPLAVASFLGAYAIVGGSAAGVFSDGVRTAERLKAAYPFESMEPRLPRPVPPSSPGDARLLAELESAVEAEAVQGPERHLRQLHENTVSGFVNSPGFGFSRLRSMPVREIPENSRADAPQQADYFHPAVPDAKAAATRPGPLALGRLHEDSFLDFVNPRGFGYVQDRRHVAGFQSHGFSKTPGPVEKWEVARLELVGLLQHEQPVVYLSAKLPRMDELKAAPTRPLDAFETAALEKLRGGADLHAGADADARRFVGAVRATRQCLGCHGGERGSLLGAFSYRLRQGE